MRHVWLDLTAGTVGGALGITVVYPLDTVKARLQTSGKYSGMVHVMTSMSGKEGVFSLYRGLLSPVAGAGIMKGIAFSAYGLTGGALLRRRGEKEGSPLALWEMTMAGACAGAANAPIRQIFERVKNVMQVRRGEKSKPPYTWSGACVVDLVRREGIVMGLFRGCSATLVRESIQSAVYYPTYHIVKNYLIPPDKRRRSVFPKWVPDQLLQMVAGGSAGCAVCVPPLYTLDVLKTRMQVAAPGVYSSMWDCAVQTWRREGAQMFYRGLGPALVRAFPMHGLTFLGYEATIAMLKNRNREPMTSPDVSVVPMSVLTARAGADVGDPS